MDFISTAASAVKSIRIQDVLDMAIIAAMIFALLIWFKTRASRFVLIGVLLLGGVYLAARFFQLYLTLIVLQGFFAILLFVLVVIFQEDLRGFFERLAMLGNLRKEVRPLSELEKAARIIAETAGNLAKKRIGALMVIAGADPLDRHLTGGVALGGLVSEPLLASIFDPHSAGHDGAVVIKNDRVEMFGCHLPLSIDIAGHGNIGLRHTAALGLTERSDALCVVVSEERGAISVAERASLTVIPNASALHEVLKQYYMRHQPNPRQGPLWGWLRENTKEKLVAVALSCILWVAFGYQRDIVRRDFMIPIEYKNIPQAWQIDEPRLTEVKIVLQGPEQAFRLFNEKSLRLSLDLAMISKKKREFVLTKDMVNAPSSVSVADISPSRIKIYASRLVAANVPVRVATKNSLPEGWTVQKIILNPSTVVVLLDPRVRPDEMVLETEPVDLRMITSSSTITLKVMPATGVSFPDGKAPEVRATIRLKKG